MEPFKDLTHLIPDPALTPDEQVMAAEESFNDDELGRVHEIPADSIRRILDLVLPSSRNADGRGYWETAVNRLAALAWQIHPEVRKYPQCEIAKAIGRTRASLNVSIIALRDLGNLDHRGGMSQSARHNFSRQKTEIWKRRKQAMEAPYLGTLPH